MEPARFSHAYIITGSPENAEREARDLAAAMLCARGGGRPCGECPSCRKVRLGIHPDILVTERQKDGQGKPRQEIYVDQIREISASAAVLPNEAERKLYVIRDAGTMNPAAQNALLKLLEEPPEFDAFLLLAENEDQLLETVRSRCVTLRAGGGEAPPSPEARELAERYLDLRLSLLSFAGANGERSVAELQEFTRAARELLADMLCGRLPARGMSPAELLRLAALMDRAGEYLRFHVSPKHILGMLAVNTVGDGRH